MSDSSAVYAPELGRIGVCTVGRAGLWFLTLDAQGRAVDGPIAIERDSQGATPFEARVTRACDIAWSGHSFLVVWLSVTGELTSFYAPGVTPQPVVYSLRAQLLRASESFAANAD